MPNFNLDKRRVIPLSATTPSRPVASDTLDLKDLRWRHEDVEVTEDAAGGSEREQDMSEGSGGQDADADAREGEMSSSSEGRPHDGSGDEGQDDSADDEDLRDPYPHLKEELMNQPDQDKVNPLEQEGHEAFMWMDETVRKSYSSPNEFIAFASIQTGPGPHYRTYLLLAPRNKAAEPDSGPVGASRSTGKPRAKSLPSFPRKKQGLPADTHAKGQQAPAAIKAEECTWIDLGTEEFDPLDPVEGYALIDPVREVKLEPVPDTLDIVCVAFRAYFGVGYDTVYNRLLGNTIFLRLPEPRSLCHEERVLAVEKLVQTFVRGDSEPGEGRGKPRPSGMTRVVSNAVYFRSDLDSPRLCIGAALVAPGHVYYLSRLTGKGQPECSIIQVQAAGRPPLFLLWQLLCARTCVKRQDNDHTLSDEDVPIQLRGTFKQIALLACNLVRIVPDSRCGIAAVFLAHAMRKDKRVLFINDLHTIARKEKRLNGNVQCAHIELEEGDGDEEHAQ